MVWALIAVIALAMVGWLLAIRYWNQQKEILPLNEAIEVQNEQYKQENEQYKQEHEELVKQRYEEEAKLSAIKETLEVQNNLLKSVTATAEIEAQRAKERAQQEHDTAVAALKQEYEVFKMELKQKKEEQEAELTLQLNKNKQEIERETRKLQELKDIQSAYIEAKRKEQEALAEIDFYRLVISPNDLEDIKILRTIQKQMSRPDVIDKIIWENYYRPSYDILMSHISANTSPCGIYKITNIATEESYIGQSVNIKERFRQHIKSGLSSSSTNNKLYQTMKQYGVENFTFMILEEVPRERLNEREAFWIDFYQTKDYGLNSTKGNT